MENPIINLMFLVLFFYSQWRQIKVSNTNKELESTIEKQKNEILQCQDAIDVLKGLNEPIEQNSIKVKSKFQQRLYEMNQKNKNS